MNVKPYVPHSVRSKQFWKKLADKLNFHPAFVWEAYMNKWCCGVGARDFHQLVMTGEITRDEVIEAGEDFLEVPISELDRRQIEHEKWAKENDFTDLLNYHLKQHIQVGDRIVSDETKTFCGSKKQYQTQGKKYRVLELDDKRDGLTDFTAITNADMKGERIWWGVHGIRSVWRGRKEIWNWHLDYLELFKEQNTGHLQTQEMIDHCSKQAEKARKGEKD